MAGSLWSRTRLQWCLDQFELRGLRSRLLEAESLEKFEHAHLLEDFNRDLLQPVGFEDLAHVLTQQLQLGIRAARASATRRAYPIRVLFAGTRAVGSDAPPPRVMNQLLFALHASPAPLHGAEQIFTLKCVPTFTHSLGKSLREIFVER